MNQRVMIIAFIAFRIKQITRLIRDAGAVIALLALVLVFLFIGFAVQADNAPVITLLLILVLTQLAGWHTSSSNTLYGFTGRSPLFAADALLAIGVPLGAMLYKEQTLCVTAVLLTAVTMYAVIALEMMPSPIRIRGYANPFRLSRSPESILFNRRFLPATILIYVAALIASLVTKSFVLPLVGILVILNFWLSVLLTEEPIGVILLYRRQTTNAFIWDRLRTRTVEFVKLTLALLALSMALQAYNDTSYYELSMFAYALMLSATPITLLIKLSDINNKRRNTLLSGIVTAFLLASFVYPFLLLLALTVTFVAIQRARVNMNQLLANDRIAESHRNPQRQGSA